MKSKYFLILLIFPVLLNAQNIIHLKKDGKLNKEICNKKARYENKNRKINISIITNGNNVLELNGIDEKLFKCNQKLNSKIIKMVFIDSENNLTYVSDNQVKIKIKCLAPKQYLVSFVGILKTKNKSIYISSTLQANETQKQTLKTN
jgi:hypothetical protein